MIVPNLLKSLMNLSTAGNGSNIVNDKLDWLAIFSVFTRDGIFKLIVSDELDWINDSDGKVASANVGD